MQTSKIDMANSDSTSNFENEELPSTFKIALRIQLAAAGISSSFLLLFVPNVETITLLAFLIGFLFPLRYGLSITWTMVIGWELLISMILSFSGITFFFKLFAWSLVTILGSFARSLHIRKSFHFAAFGIFSTLLFDIITTLSIPILFFQDESSFLSVFIAYFIFGIPFTIAHTISNTLFFAFLPTLLLTIIPILKIKFPFLIDLDEGYFDRGMKYAKSLFLITLLVISALTYGMVMYSSKSRNSSSDNLEIIIEINYAGIQANEQFNITTPSQSTILLITQKVALVSVTYKYGPAYIDGINGVMEDQDIKGYFWIVYINQQKSPVGVSAKLNFLGIENGDHIIWNYEASY